jgi:hypothetical protein
MWADRNGAGAQAMALVDVALAARDGRPNAAGEEVAVAAAEAGAVEPLLSVAEAAPAGPRVGR